MSEQTGRFEAWSRNEAEVLDGDNEVILPGKGSFVWALQRHSSFKKEKVPNMIDAETGKNLGPADAHIPEEGRGHFGPTGEEAIGVALEIPGLTDEAGAELTVQSGIDFAELLADDEVPTHIIMVASPSRWPNEQYMHDDIQHEFGARTFSTGNYFREGVEMVAEQNPQITISNMITPDERLGESGYQYVYDENRPGANKHHNLIASVAGDIAAEVGHKGNPNELFISGNEELIAAAKAMRTRIPKEIDAGIREMFTEIHDDPEIQELMESGVRVVVVGETHAQTSKSFAFNTLGDVPKVATPGFRDSEMVFGQLAENEGHKLFSPIGNSNYK